MIITVAIHCEPVGKSNKPPCFHHQDSNRQPLTCPYLLVGVVQTTGRIPPACPVFLLHTALITVGVSSLTACGATVCTIRVDYAALQMVGALLTPSLPRPHPFTRGCTHCAAGGGEGTSRPASLPGLLLKDMFMSGE